MRKPLAIVGAGLLAVGIAVFLICAFVASQAAADFFNCVGSNPYSGPIPTGCMGAVANMVLYSALEWVGILMGIVGIVLLILGLILEPPRPEFSPPAYYAPPVYGPPSSYPPPQGPQAPPSRP